MPGGKGGGASEFSSQTDLEVAGIAARERRAPDRIAVVVDGYSTSVVRVGPVNVRDGPIVEHVEAFEREVDDDRVRLYEREAGLEIEIRHGGDSIRAVQRLDEVVDGPVVVVPLELAVRRARAKEK